MKNFEFSETIERSKYKTLGDFHEGMAKVTDYRDRVGFIDNWGNEIIPPKYLDAKDFSEGLAAVKINEDTWIFIDKEGNKVFDREFLEVESFSEGFAAVKVLKDSNRSWTYRSWTYINKKGKNIKEPSEKHKKLYPFKEGFGLAYNGNDGYQIIDETGKTRYYHLATNFSNGRALVKKSPFLSEAQIIDTDFNVLGTVDENIIFESPVAESGLVRVKLPEGKKYFGELSIKDYVYAYLDLLTGKLLPPVFYEASDFKNGNAIVKPQKNQNGFVNTDGATISYYTNIEIEEDFSDNLVAFKDVEKELYGFLNNNGKEVIPARYKKVGNHSDGVIAVEDKNGFNYYMRKDESIYMSFPHEFVTSINTGSEVIVVSASSPYELAIKKLQTLKLIKESMLSRIEVERSNIASEVYEMESKTI